MNRRSTLRRTSHCGRLPFFIQYRPIYIQSIANACVWKCRVQPQSVAFQSWKIMFPTLNHWSFGGFQMFSDVFQQKNMFLTLHHWFSHIFQVKHGKHHWKSSNVQVNHGKPKGFLHLTCHGFPVDSAEGHRFRARLCGQWLCRQRDVRGDGTEVVIGSLEFTMDKPFMVDLWL